MALFDPFFAIANHVREKGLAPIILAGFFGSACLLLVVYRPFSKHTVLRGIEPYNEVRVKLRRKKLVGLTTCKLTFELPGTDSILGLPIGQHIQVVKRPPNGSPDSEKTVIHSYTPTSLVKQHGYFDLVVKEYKPEPKYPNGGVLSQYICGLSVGDLMTIRGPKGSIEYKGNGHLEISETEGKRFEYVKSIGMICGGTGISPMYQVAQEILNSPEDKTEMSILFGNQSPSDILMKDDLDLLHEKSEGQLKVFYTVDATNDQKFDHFVGLVNESMIKSTMPPPGEGVVILLCGPPVMVKEYLPGILLGMGYEKRQIITF